MADSERVPTPEEVQAAIAKTVAETEKIHADRDAAQALTRETIAKAVKAELEVARLQREEAATLARNSFHQVYVFDSSVSASSVDACITKLTEWSRNSPGCDIEIIFNSPGGNVVSGFALYDFLTLLKKKGHKLTTSSIGMAASMAGILLQAGDVRKMGAEGWLLIHEGQFGAVGSVGEVEDTVEWAKMLREHLLDILSSRALISKTQIKRRWHRKDWWLDAEEALKLGFIDEIG